MTSIRRNIVALYVLQSANYLLPLVVVPYLVRILGPDGYGRVAFAQSFIGYFVVLTDYGFNLSATRAISLAREDENQLSSTFTAVFLVKTGFMIACFALLVVLVNLVPRFAQDRELYLLSFLAVLGNVLFPIWFFQGIERMRVITGLSILARTLSTAAIFLFVHHDTDYRLAAGIQAGSPVIAGLGAIIMIPRLMRINLRWPGFATLRAVTTDGWHIFLSTAAISLYTSSSVFVLGIICTPTIVGYFSAAQKLIKAASSLASPVSQAVYPRVAYLASRTRETALEFVGRLLLWQGLAMFATSLALLVLSRPLVLLALGPRFSPSVQVVDWMAALPFIVGLSNVYGIQIMLNFGMKQTFSRILIFSGVLNLALLPPLAHWFGAQGAAISVLFTEFTVTVSMGLALKRRHLLPRIGVHSWTT